MNRTKVGIAGAVAAGCIGLGGVIALAGADSAPTTPTGQSVRDSVPELAIFKSDAPSVPASRLAEIIGHLPPGTTASDIQASKAVPLGNGAEAAVISAGLSVCVVVTSTDGSGGTSCAPKEQVIDPSRPPILVDHLPKDQFRVTILAAPGINTLTVALADGSTTKTKVVNNIASTIVTSEPPQVSWDGPGAGAVSPAS